MMTEQKFIEICKKYGLESKEAIKASVELAKEMFKHGKMSDN